MKERFPDTQVVMANSIWLAGTYPKALAWEKASKDVQTTQENKLLRIIEANRSTQFGQDHNFIRIQSPRDYQKKVDVVTYEELNPYIQKAAEGEKNVLTREKVIVFEPTSGSTSASKIIPLTETKKGEFQQGIEPMLHYMYRGYPGILLGRTYWSVTPVGIIERHTNGGIRIGFEDDSQYLSSLQQFIYNKLKAVPSEIARIQDMSKFKQITLQYLLVAEDLSLLSIWNPTYLTTLLDNLKLWLPEVTANIAQGVFGKAQDIADKFNLMASPDLKRAKEIEHLCSRWKNDDLRQPLQNGRTFYEELWPRLALISCWADAFAKQHVEKLKEYFPTTPIQPKGLVATEAFVSFPIGRKEGSALSLNSHFFEFLDHEGNIKLAHELQKGKVYKVIVTTGGGLYRYNLNDEVEVIGHYHECPMIRFVGKADKTIDMVGEKLNEIHVQRCIEEIILQYNLSVDFWMLAPYHEDNVNGYILFVESNLTDDKLIALKTIVEMQLKNNIYYRHATEIGQLQSLKVFRIAGNAGTTYLEICSGELKQRLGEIKPSSLHPYPKWHQKFSGQFVIEK